MIIYTAIDRTPYTYLIGWSKLNIWYYGVRYAKNCHPSDLWSPYKTSSKLVKSMIIDHGTPDIIQVRKTFTSIDSARLWEENVLKKTNAVYRTDFLNQHNSKAFKPCYGSENRVVKQGGQSQEIRNKISQTRKLKKIEPIMKGKNKEWMIENNYKVPSGRPKGSKSSEQGKKNRSLATKGKIRVKDINTDIISYVNADNKNLNITLFPHYASGYKFNHDQETKDKLSVIALNRPTHWCEICQCSIKGNMNWDRHLKSNKHLSQLKS